MVAAFGWPRLGYASVAPVLTGTDFDLIVDELPVNFTGRTRMAVAVNGSVPAPTLRWRESTTVELRVRNALPPDSIHGRQASIHWHGILLPANMDGVPGMSFDGIGPGETYRYRFALKQSGTYWYHSHSGYQEQAGLYGALIVDAAEPEPFDYQQVARVSEAHPGWMASVSRVRPATLPGLRHQPTRKK